MTVQELTYAVIDSGHGRMVADQFNDSYESGNFERQNVNALGYIKSTVKELLDSELLDKWEVDDLIAYFADLKEYLKQF
jgi:hypothetical protein